MTSHHPTPGQRRLLWLALTCLAVAVLISLVGGLCWGLALVIDLLSPVLWPLAVAAVIACVLAPGVDWLETRRFSRTQAILVVYLFAFLLVGGVLATVIPQLISETEQLIGKIPDYAAQLQHRLASFLAQPPEFLRHFLPATQAPVTPGASPVTPADKALASISAWLSLHSAGLGTWLFQQKDKVLNLFSVFAGLALIPIYIYYFLAEREAILNQWKEYLPIKNTDVKRETVFILESINMYLVAFFRGQVLVAVCESVLYTIGFEFAGLNYGFLLGFAALFLIMIPFLGTTILCVASLLLAVVQYGDWTHPLIVLGIVCVVQTLESFVISPKIIGDRVGLHPMIIIIAVIAGTTLLGGVLGGLLAIPLAAALRVILGRYLWKTRDAT